MTERQLYLNERIYGEEIDSVRHALNHRTIIHYFFKRRKICIKNYILNALYQFTKTFLVGLTLLVLRRKFSAIKSSRTLRHELLEISTLDEWRTVVSQHRASFLQRTLILQDGGSGPILEYYSKIYAKKTCYKSLFLRLQKLLSKRIDEPFF